ncbi:MAG: hypothetical protein V1870_04580 [Candidatus Aenigmatarchaeota archaeon]
MKIVISGGTYAGKTSIIHEFSKEGYKTIPDIGMHVIEELNKKMGTEKQKAWRKKHPREFYEKIVKKTNQIRIKYKIR